MSASPFARLLIIGLWTEAWDDGVFEWKPIVIKARLFPADACDISELLGELSNLGVIKKVERGGKPYGLIRNFRRFQRPKKPNSSGVVLPADADFLGPEHTSSEPVPNQFRTDTENPPQMEDGGGRKEGSSPEPTHQEAAREPEKPPIESLELKTRKRVASVYTSAGHLPPETGRVVSWMKRGHDPDVIVATIEDRLSTGPPPRSLAYFDGMIADRCASPTVRNPGTRTNASRSVPQSAAAVLANLRAGSRQDDRRIDPGEWSGPVLEHDPEPPKPHRVQ